MIGRPPVAVLLAIGLLSCTTLAAQAPELPLINEADRALPIELDAAFSELDRRNDRLVFRDLRVVQGGLSITANEASASPADFSNSVWTFTGSVVIRNGATEARCERAELTFSNNELRKAVLSGNPARFVQSRGRGTTPTEGRGRTLEYDLRAGTIRMVNDAFLSDGSNEITGSLISYDLVREVVTAGSADGGDVRMRITPRQDSTPKPDGASGGGEVPSP